MKFISTKIIIALLLVLALLMSSCSTDEEQVVFSGNDKTISKAAYQYFYTQNLKTIVEQYKSYYETYGSYGETFKSYFGFLPDGTEEYWETTFLNEKIFDNNTLSVGQYLDKSSNEACKEYIVLEKIAKDYGYKDLPDDIKKEYDSYVKTHIDTYGSMEAWNIATIAQYGLTAEEILDITLVSLYRSYLPLHIFGEKGENISDEKSLQSLESAIQFKYSIYYYLTEEDLENNKEDESSEETGDSSETSSENTSDSLSEIPSDDVSVSSSETEGDKSASSESVSEKNTKETSQSSVNAEHDSSEISADSSEASSEDTESDASSNDEENNLSDVTSENLEEFNKQYREKMKANYEAVLSGEKTFDEVYKDSDEYEYWEKNSPDGALLEIKDFEEFFKLDNESYNEGDVLYIESDVGVYLIQILPFSESFIESRKATLIDEEFKKILEEYFKDIEENKELLSTLTKYTDD